MATWQDYAYFISHVRYDTNYNYITMLKVRHLVGDYLQSAEVWKKQSVVERIRGGYHFATVTESQNGNWKLGETVRTYTRNGITYLRTDSNSVASDNLGNLPEF